MLECPSCHALGIYEHSVQMKLDDLSAARAVPIVYSRCTACDAVFRRGETGELVTRSDEPLDRVVWTIPPWKDPTTEASFELSWDLVVHHFDRLSQTLTHLRPLLDLVLELRAAGFGPRLRAGQSVASLGLSRAKEHGLRPDQSHLFLAPQRDGSVAITGILRATPVELGPVRAAFDGELARSIRALAELPID